MSHTAPKSALQSPLAVALVAAALAAWPTGARADDLKVAAPNAVKESVMDVADRFEKRTGLRVTVAWGGSESIAKQVADGQVFDVVVNTATGVDRMATDGKVQAGSRVDFSRSAVAVAARAGLPPPDVSSVAALKAALLSAQSIAISSGASGRYLEQLFQKLGLTEQIKHKIRQPPSGAQIGDMLAAGDADLGFQQVTELMHARGVQYLGPLPAEVQNYTVWAAGVHVHAPNADAARAFIRELRAPASVESIRRSGMDPL